MVQINKRQQHWENTYATKAEGEVSWFQKSPDLSLALIAATGVGREARLVDVGGGASRIVDALLDAGFKNLTVLDIAESGLEHAKARLGDLAGKVTWVVHDVTIWQPEVRFELWHDRAVFHFLTDAVDRRDYMDVLHRALAPGGHVILAAFGPNGPERCSGLPVVRYNAEALAKELGGEFRLEEERAETHKTPGGVMQHYRYVRFTLP